MMDVESQLPKDITLPLFATSGSTNLGEALEVLIEASRTADGRSDLASKAILPSVLLLSEELRKSNSELLVLSSMKLLRNLCAGEIRNQDLFIENNGIEIVLTVLRAAMVPSDPDCSLIRIGLQVLANASLAGERHQRSIWVHFFPIEFLDLARIRSRQTIDPLCMTIYACCDGNDAFMKELCGDKGLLIVAEIIRTVSLVGFGENWFKVLLSRICLEGPHLPNLFPKFCADYTRVDREDVIFEGETFSLDQSFLLSVVAEILNERLEEITVTADFASFIFHIYKKSAELVDFHSRGKSALPTGSATIDVLGYSLTILRDICAQDGRETSDLDESSAADSLLSVGLVDLLLSLLSDLEPPAIVRKAVRHVENQEGRIVQLSKVCPYRGFRRDLVAVIGNCAYRRKHVQDEIRHKDSICLLLQQCVTDEENPYLREWGIWAAKNLLLDNDENQQEVMLLKLQGSVNLPEISELGLRVEIDPETGRPKLVNCK